MLLISSLSFVNKRLTISTLPLSIAKNKAVLFKKIKMQLKYYIISYNDSIENVI